MNGRKISVRNTAAPGLLARTRTASPYPTARIGTVTMAVYFSVKTIESRKSGLRVSAA